MDFQPQIFVHLTCCPKMKSHAEAMCQKLGEISILGFLTSMKVDMSSHFRRILGPICGHSSGGLITSDGRRQLVPSFHIAGSEATRLHLPSVDEEAESHDELRALRRRAQREQEACVVQRLGSSSTPDFLKCFVSQFDGSLRVQKIIEA